MSDEALTKPLKQMDQFDDLFAHNTQFFSSYNPDMIEEALLNSLRQEKVEPLVAKNKYKTKFTLYGKDELDPAVEDNVEMCIRILRVPDQSLSCIEFTKLSGRQTTFLRHAEHIKSKVLGFANDSILK